MFVVHKTDKYSCSKVRHSRMRWRRLCGERAGGRTGAKGEAHWECQQAPSIRIRGLCSAARGRCAPSHPRPPRPPCLSERGPPPLRTSVSRTRRVTLALTTLTRPPTILCPKPSIPHLWLVLSEVLAYIPTVRSTRTVSGYTSDDRSLILLLASSIW